MFVVYLFVEKIDRFFSRYFIRRNINFYHRWTIRVRVQSKDPIRTYVNQKGEGKVFGMIIADESDDMKCTGFNSEVDRFYDMFEVNKVSFEDFFVVKISK